MSESIKLLPIYPDGMSEEEKSQFLARKMFELKVAAKRGSDGPAADFAESLINGLSGLSDTLLEELEKKQAELIEAKKNSFSLRDKFAAHALPVCGAPGRMAAKTAYEIADAMLKERNNDNK